jgi:hypothetical protein
LTTYFYTATSSFFAKKAEDAVGGETNGLRHFDLPQLQLRDFRESDSELAEEKSSKGAEDDSTETVEDAAVILLRLHDVDGLNRVVVCGVVFGHDRSLL